MLQARTQTLVSPQCSVRQCQNITCIFRSLQYEKSPVNQHRTCTKMHFLLGGCANVFRKRKRIVAHTPSKKMHYVCEFQLLKLGDCEKFERSVATGHNNCCTVSNSW